MSASNFEIEVKVGFFVSLGIGLVMLAILTLGSTENILSRKNHYEVHMSNAEGLIQGAKVVIGGVSIGTVQDIGIDEKKHDIRVDLSIASESAGWIHKDATAEIATQGVLGDKFVSISPGTESEPVIRNGAEIPYVQSKGLSQFLTKGDQLLVTVNELATNLDRVMRAFNAQNRSEIFFQGLASTSKSLSQASEKLNHELDSVKLEKIIRNLESITDKLNNGTGTMGALINDPALYDNVKLLVGQANQNRIVRNLVRQTIRDSEDRQKGGEEPKK